MTDRDKVERAPERMAELHEGIAESHIDSVRGPVAMTAKEHRDTAKLIRALQADRRALREALEFYADRNYDGYDIDVTNYGLSTQGGPIIRDGGEIARAALHQTERDG